MMTESEFLSLSEGGGMEERKQQFKRKHDKKTSRNIKKEPKKVPQNKGRSIGFDITGECEPSSSKIKVLGYKRLWAEGQLKTGLTLV
jgi:hypothetical protein